MPSLGALPVFPAFSYRSRPTPPHPHPQALLCKANTKAGHLSIPAVPRGSGRQPRKERPHGPQPSNNPGDRVCGGGVLSVTPIAEMTMLLCVYRTPSRAPRGTFPRADPGLASCVHSASSADDQREPRHCNFWARHPSQLKQDKRPAQPEHVQPSTGHASHSHLVLLQSPTLE